MPITVAELIEHPEKLDKETLYGLREIVARYPYYQAARILFLQNLFLLHDTSFGEELRKAAIYVADRRVLFNMVEGNNYEIQAAPLEKDEADKAVNGAENRTQSLIDRFLQNDRSGEEVQTPRRKLTAADATTDYVAFLMQMEDAEPAVPETAATGQQRSLRNSRLIDDFIENKPERIVLQETPEYLPLLPEYGQEEGNDEDYFTETLAKIYIKQGRYEKAMEIIRKLNLNYPKKNRYFADQMRFLQKLIINKKYNK